MAHSALAAYANMFSLHAQVVLVTGGYGHLGRAIVLGLAAHGANVVVLGRNPAAFTEAFAGLENVYFQACDVAETDSVKAAFAHVRAQFGLPAVLVNNAFYSRGNQPDALTDEDFAFGLDGSLGSAYRCIREVLPYMRERGAGKIINVASMYGVVAPDFAAYEATPQFTNPPHYGAAKAGVIQLTKYFASYLGPHRIQVNCVTPGAFPSPGVQQHAEFVQQLEQRSPLGRIGQPQDLAGAFVFLASAASDFVTGHNLVVDGGWTIR
ncbi:SDR family NAD(P)-dependent oxidoreductase [Hymenobacter latericus]|uniref:SDR family NAD(P)-dependent oxidoreductase n=1 Tax=Hymenobacter sp. YIM 151858-1 TaxID=2987688 RepID=UPI0022261CDD|nr:SDR family oxidoreductase [Hymenobacter sp. YIM 151858-1]UYZ60582.1 SDR family oxidoreductase [Hymenobacter sp. YIM 151858-1]